MKFYPSPSTQINIAQCFEHEEKVASAWGAYQRAVALNRETKDQIRREAIDQLAKEGSARVEPSLPRNKVVVQTAPPGLRVTEDTQELPAESYGLALPTDPGPHQFVASAPGYEELRITVTAEKGKQVDVPLVLKALAKQNSVVPPSGPVSGPPPAQGAPRGDAPEREKTSTPALAWATGGVGLIALGVGAGFGGAAVAKQGAISSACGAQEARGPASRELRRGAKEGPRRVERGFAPLQRKLPRALGAADELRVFSGHSKRRRAMSVVKSVSASRGSDVGTGRAARRDPAGGERARRHVVPLGQAPD
jgi:hypothetical protein